MQFFAYMGSQIIFAEEARKGRDYRCPECHGRLRVKKGLHRRKHFFHLSNPLECRQNKKNELHLTIQKNLSALLPSGQSCLEKSFPAINRIADLVWEPQKTIFEIQCSPISLEEVKGRMKDYASEGYRVIWILHDKCFNKYRLSAAEAFLRPHHAIFTSMNQKGLGMVYDQYEIFLRHLRTKRGPPLPVDITSPLEARPLPPSTASPSSFKWMKKRFRFFYYLILKNLTH